MNQPNIAVHVLFAAAALWVATAAPTGLDAQESAWLPWVGCWEGATEMGEESGSETFLVCFEPADDPAAVEIVTYGETGDVTAREQMFADGEPRPIEVDGCAGSRTARWSEHGFRVFLSSEMSCGAVARTTTGVLSILPGGNGWLEIQAVRAESDEPVLGIRSFLPASSATLDELGVTDPAADRGLAVETARSAAGQRLTPAALVETVEQAGPEVTSALLVERGDDLGVDARTLEALASRGVPGEVLDVMVAVSFPDRFEISGGDDAAEPRVQASEQRAARSGSEGRVSRNAYGYSPWSWNYGAYWAPFRYDRYGSLWSRRSGLGYGGYYGYPGYYDRPRYIVVQPPTVEDRVRLSRERGVVRGGDSADDGGASTTRIPSASRGDSDSGSRPAVRSSPPRRDGGSSTSSGGGSTSSGSASPSSGGSSSSGDDVRRARPR